MLTMNNKTILFSWQLSLRLAIEEGALMNLVAMVICLGNSHHVLVKVAQYFFHTQIHNCVLEEKV